MTKWRHENGLAAEKKAALRQDRIDKERATAEAVATQLRELGVEDVSVEQPNGSVYVRLHKYIHLAYRYRKAALAFNPCEGMVLVSNAPFIGEMVRHYKLDWESDTPKLVDPRRVAKVIEARRKLILEHADELV